MNAPFIAFFSLPVYWIGFPRPARQWPSSGTSSTDTDPEVKISPDWPLYTTYSEQILLAISKSFSKFHPRKDQVLICRFESRILLIHVIESWYEGCYCILKGLELSGTSCHSLESVRIDDIFSSTSLFNENYMNALTPLGDVEITTFVESKSSMTGIMDNRDTLKLIPSTLIKVLVWMLVRRDYKRYDYKLDP